MKQIVWVDARVAEHIGERAVRETVARLAGKDAKVIFISEEDLKPVRLNWQVILPPERMDITVHPIGEPKLDRPYQPNYEKHRPAWRNK